MINSLNIAAISEHTRDVLGPGMRMIIWLQGCPFNCENCVSPEWITDKPANVVSIEKLARVIIDDKLIDGITFSGGEPMQQAAGLNLLLDRIMSYRSDLNVICFTGYKIARLKSAVQQALLRKVDVLIDGLYVDHLNDGKGLRGSSNQRIHMLTDKLSKHKEFLEEGERKFELIDRGMEWMYIGVPEKGLSQILI